MVAVPTKLLAGVKSTSPVFVLTDQVLPLLSVNVVCCPGVEGSRSIVPCTMLLPVPKAVSLVVMSPKVTGVFNVVVVESSVATGGFGIGIVTIRFAVALCPNVSSTVYGIVAVPTKLFAGVNNTSPVVVSTVQVLPLPSVKVVCCPTVEGSKSIVLRTMLLPVPKAVSLAVISLRVTGVFNVVVVESSVAIGGAMTGVNTDGVQRAVAGQVGSPPPLTLAVLVTLGTAAIVGVTGITKLVLAFTANPAATVQVTACPTAEHPAGIVPGVSPAGSVSVIVDTAVVATVPVFVNCNV